MRSSVRSSLVIALVAVLFVATAPTAAASTSKITFTLTLHGHVPPGIGFDLGLAPGVGGSNPFCVAANDHTLDDVGVPICRSGRTYTTVVALVEGESVEYSVTLYHPTSARVLWSGNLTGDGRSHRRAYVVDFDLPATDAARPTLTTAPMTGLAPATLPILVVAWFAGWAAWLAVAHRRRLTVRP